MKPDQVPFKEYERMYRLSVDRLGEFHMVQANLPRDWGSYSSGNGEGIWIIIDDETLQTLASEKGKGTFYGVPCVPSFYFPQLSYRIVDQRKRLLTPVEFEYRGRYRPVLAKRELETLIGKR